MRREDKNFTRLLLAGPRAGRVRTTRLIESESSLEERGAPRLLPPCPFREVTRSVGLCNLVCEGGSLESHFISISAYVMLRNVGYYPAQVCAHLVYIS